MRKDRLVFKNKLLVFIKRINRFHQLGYKRKLILIISFIIMGVIRLAILIVPFKYLVVIMGERMVDSPFKIENDQLKKAVVIGWAVNTMSRFTPWESKCLVRALTVQILLKRMKIASTLYLGIKKETSKRLTAHAWLRCGHLILTGGIQKENFKEIARFTTLFD